jgi:hypothetical protein
MPNNSSHALVSIPLLLTLYLPLHHTEKSQWPNYFTIAGVSYYRSPEFERQHLGFEPISRFGVGVLSCFMGADKLMVKTYRDPESGPPMAHSDCHLPSAAEYRARRLSLEIPGIDRQFIVKELNEEFTIGTEVSLEVLSAKLRSIKNFKPTLPSDGEGTPEAEPFTRLLKITEYLRDIAGFVEFPILVEERLPNTSDPTLTLILHPDRDPEAEVKQYQGNIKVHQLCRDYPWEIVTKTDSLPAVHESMGQREFNLRKIIESTGYEGWVIFPKPKHENWDFSDRLDDNSQDADETFWFDRSTRLSPCSSIRWKSDRFIVQNKSNKNRLLRVYRDGILLVGINNANIPHSSAFPQPLILVNLPSTKGEPTNVARTKLSDTHLRWDKPIWRGIEETVGKEIQSQTTLPLKDIVFNTGWIANVYRLSPLALSRLIPKSQFVTAWLLTNGSFELRAEELTPGELIPLIRRFAIPGG